MLFQHSSASIWQVYKGRTDRSLICPCGLRILRHTVSCPQLRGKRILFISDLHIRGERVLNLSPHGCFSWKGIEWVRQALRESLDIVQPDYFLFGGDLIGESVWLPEAFDLFRAIPDSVPKFAVPGNWDKRRHRWLPHREWADGYARVGVRYLVNESVACPGIVFSGLDDFKIGDPRFTPPSIPGSFSCVISHNPDSIPQALSPDDLAGVRLILCGHTHAGQIRLPGFGAFRTSSLYWKKFERGWFRSRISDSELLVSAGIGITWIPLRLFCPPEAVWIDFAP